jgi:hypothetical protein
MGRRPVPPRRTITDERDNRGAVVRVVLEALLIVGGALLLFKFLYQGFLNIRHRERAAQQAEREREDSWLNDNLRTKRGN